MNILNTIAAAIGYLVIGIMVVIVIKDVLYILKNVVRDARKPKYSTHCKPGYSKSKFYWHFISRIIPHDRSHSSCCVARRYRD